MLTYETHSAMNEKCDHKTVDHCTTVALRAFQTLILYLPDHLNVLASRLQVSNFLAQPSRSRINELPRVFTQGSVLTVPCTRGVY